MVIVVKSITMSLLPKIKIDVPNSSNVDLGRVNRFSCSIGPLYPVLTEQVFPGDKVSLGVSALIKTVPLLGPLMGSAKVQLDTFFIPLRLYIQQLHDDATGFDPFSIYLPQVRHGLGALPPSGPGSMPFDTSSVWHFLGMGNEFVRTAHTPSGGGPSNYRNFNAVPWLGYWDIFRAYYANTQEEKAAYIVTDTLPPEFKPLVYWYDLENIDKMRRDLLSHDASVAPYVIYNNTGLIGHPYNSNITKGPSGGLALRTFLPDRFSAWVSTDTYNASNSISAIRAAVTDGVATFTMDELRFSNKLNQMLQKTAVSGGRYSDWQEVQYGARLKTLNETPQFLGSFSSELTFEDVVQTSASVEDNPLGTLGGRGVGYLGNRKINFRVPENGFIMTVLSIVPRVDYYQGIKHFYRQTTLGDIHVPSMDSIGFQDLLTDEFASFDTVSSGEGKLHYNSVGKQPAWTELMTATNEIHGDFANPDRLMYMTFARTFNQVSDVDHSLERFSSYIIPSMFNQNFADTSIEAQNLWVQLKFDLIVNRRISKRLMPTL